MFRAPTCPSLGVPHLVTNPGKLPGSCSFGLLDMCTAQRMWPHHLSIWLVLYFTQFSKICLSCVTQGTDLIYSLVLCRRAVSISTFMLYWNTYMRNDIQQTCDSFYIGMFFYLTTVTNHIPLGLLIYKTSCNEYLIQMRCVRTKGKHFLKKRLIKNW
jgi:hypothetical protein